MVGRSQMPRKKKFTTKIGMETAGGVMHYVVLTGPESAVAAVLALVALGRDAQGAGITPEKLSLARSLAMQEIGKMARSN